MSKAEEQQLCKKPFKFYTYDEVVIHNTIDDFWVVIHGNVLNLTPLMCDRRDSWNPNMEYLKAFGGKNLSRYFYENGLPKTEISITTGKRRPIFYPAIEVAQSELCKTPGKLWSRDPLYQIGRLTSNERAIRIINTLTGVTYNMKVCEEDSIYEIQDKYRELYNSHAGSYTWRKFVKGPVSNNLSLNRTLTENGLLPEKNRIGPPPALMLFYNDDFTIA